MMKRTLASMLAVCLGGVLTGPGAWADGPAPAVTPPALYNSIWPGGVSSPDPTLGEGDDLADHFPFAAGHR